MQEDIQCDLLLFVATQSEQEQLETVAHEFGISFQPLNHPRLGECWLMGRLGDFRVVAVKTRMGSLGYQGSASQGIFARIATGATNIVQLGMAFGIGSSNQRFGDVLVSSSLVPY